VFVKARTGSGKTLAYVLPILNKCYHAAASATSSKPRQVLILLPTKELCKQVEDVVTSYSGNVVSVKTFFPRERGSSAEDDESLDSVILITTTKALLSLGSRLKQVVENVETIVFDEADKIFQEDGQGFTVPKLRLHSSSLLILRSHSYARPVYPLWISGHDDECYA
jgi:superfamily II DNA/RNA helicase